jgi:hypothetical protein
LRDIIYRFAILDPNDIWVDYRGISEPGCEYVGVLEIVRGANHNFVKVLRVNEQIREEASSIFYEEN